MEDLFEVEQKVLDNAILYASELKDGNQLEPAKYHELLEGYGSLLKQFRKLIAISDRTGGSLHANKYDLLGKVYYDALTGIYNRWFLEDNLPRITRTLSRTGSALSIMMADIDFFKRYNDTYGHNMGDTCLKAVAETIAVSLSRGSDFVARYGGEEFVILLPHTNENGARLMADKILEKTRALNIPHAKNDASNCITVSIGVTTVHVTHTQKYEDYVKRADEALYHSKQNGRNRYTYFDF